MNQINNKKKTFVFADKTNNIYIYIINTNTYKKILINNINTDYKKVHVHIIYNINSKVLLLIKYNNITGKI